MRISDSFICFIQPNGSRDVYHGARLLWIYRVHLKFCGRLLLDIFLWRTLTESPKNDQMIYFPTSTVWVTDKPKSEAALKTPLFLSLCLSVSPVLSGLSVTRGKASLSVCVFLIGCHTGGM